MKHRLTILTALLVFAAGTASAQFNETNNLFYFTQRAPQANMLNPAFFPRCGFYLQLPATNLQMGIPLALSEIVVYHPEEQRSVIDVNDVLGRLGENSMFRLTTDINLVGMGFKVKNLFLDFNTRLVFNTNLSLPVSVINAIINGNVDENGNAINEITLLDGNLFNMQAYMETSVGAGYRLSVIPLTIGVHAKLLSGIFNLNLDETRVTFETSDDFDEVTATAYYKVQTATPVPIDTTGGGIMAALKNIPKHLGESINTMFDPFNGNTGLAFDFGAKYDIGPFSISASIVDLTAGIHWQNNVNSLVPRGGQGESFTFNGANMDITSMLNGGQFNIDTLTTNFTEKLNNLMPEGQLNQGDFWYTIPTKINVAASFTFLKMLRAGILFHGQFDRGLLSKSNYRELDLSGNVKNTFRHNTTVSLSANLFNWMEIIVGSSMVFDGSGNFNFMDNMVNPGAGIILSVGTVAQSYVMVDYMSSFYLTDVKALNVKFGLNVLLGKK